MVPGEVARVAGILCGSGRGVLARGGGGPTCRVGCVLAAQALAHSSRRSPIVHRVTTSVRQGSPPNGGHPNCYGRPNPSLVQGHLQKHVLQLHGTPVQRHTPVGHSTRSTMVAKDVMLAATSAGAHGQGKGQVKSPAQEKAERLRVQSCRLGCRQNCEWCRRQRALLRPDERHCRGVET